MAIKKDTLDDLLAGRDPKAVFSKDGLFDELKKALAERVLNAELDDHLGTIRVKIPDEGLVRNKAVYLALGVAVDGTKDILGLWIETTEGAKFWLKVMNDLKARGVEDILIAVVDGLKGFPEEIEAVFPQAAVFFAFAPAVGAILFQALTLNCGNLRRRCQAKGPSPKSEADSTEAPPRDADDAVLHCKSRRQAEYVLGRVRERFQACNLELHPSKTRVVYCKDINRECQESCARGRVSSGSDEAVAEHHGELGFRLGPFARRHFPFESHLAQDQKDEFCRRLVAWEMPPGPHGAPQLGV
jgi:hypothetical protein